VVGVVLFSIFLTSFLQLMAGMIPVGLLVGGGVAVYMNRSHLIPGRFRKSEPAPLEQVPVDASSVKVPPATEKRTPPPVKASPVVEVKTLPSAEETSVAEKIEVPQTEPVPEDVLPVEEKPDNVAETSGAGDAGLVGNEDSLVFHAPDCKFAASKKCTVVFSSRKAAVEKGYKPCGVCKP